MLLEPPLRADSEYITDSSYKRLFIKIEAVENIKNAKSAKSAISGDFEGPYFLGVGDWHS